MANNNTNNLALRSILDKDKLNGTNFVDWQRNLCIVLRMDEKEYVLEKPIPPAPPANAPKAVKDAYEKHVKDDNQDLGDASYALGIRIYRDRSRKLLGLSQSTYIDKVLARFSMSESKRGSLPMAQGTSLSKTQSASTPEEVERMRNVSYASAIGSIMYAM
ncbi:unnamed protein product, partial [Cuscuta campestris]